MQQLPKFNNLDPKTIDNWASIFIGRFIDEGATTYAAFTKIQQP